MVNPLHLSILPSGLKERIRDAMAHSRPTEELLAMSDVVLHHEVPIQPPDTRDDHLIRRRNRYTAAASALSSSEQGARFIKFTTDLADSFRHAQTAP